MSGRSSPLKGQRKVSSCFSKNGRFRVGRALDFVLRTNQLIDDTIAFQMWQTVELAVVHALLGIDHDQARLL